MRETTRIKILEGEDMRLWEDYPGFKSIMEDVEFEIKKAIRSRQSLIVKATSELVHAGGKRLRPALVLLSHFYGEEENPNIHRLAAAVEIFHMATLVHDDIIDESEIRRGVRTTQAKWGKGVAVFTGDYLLSKAFLSFSKYSRNKDIIQASFIAKNMCEGEIEQFHSRFKVDISLKRYLWRIKCKTAYLFSFCCWLGAMESKASKSITNILRRYGNYLGMAFQIKDDILDFIGNQEKVGKPLGSDIKNGIYTLPVIYALKKGGRSKELRQILEKGSFTHEDVSKIIQMVTEDGGVDFANNLLLKYILKAKKEMEQLPRMEYTSLMYQLVEGIKTREY